MFDFTVGLLAGVFVTFAFCFFGWVLLSERKIYKVSIFTLHGSLVGSVNVKAFNSNSAIKKGYKFIIKHCNSHFMLCFPTVEEVFIFD